MDVFISAEVIEEAIEVAGNLEIECPKFDWTVGTDSIRGNLLATVDTQPLLGLLSGDLKSSPRICAANSLSLSFSLSILSKKLYLDFKTIPIAVNVSEEFQSCE